MGYILIKMSTRKYESGASKRKRRKSCKKFTLYCTIFEPKTLCYRISASNHHAVKSELKKAKMGSEFTEEYSDTDSIVFAV